VKNLIITAGELSLSYESGYEQRREIEEKIVHESFSVETYENDIALLKVSFEIKLFLPAFPFVHP